MAVRRFKGFCNQRFRIHPDERQEQFLKRNLGCARKVYNILVELGNYRDGLARAWHDEAPEERAGEAYPLAFPWPSIKHMKAEFPYMEQADSQALARAMRLYFANRGRHFEIGIPRPDFKHKWGQRNSYETSNVRCKEPPSKWSIRVVDERDDHRGNRLILPKLPRHAKEVVDEKSGKKRRVKVPDGIAIDLYQKINGVIKSAKIELDVDGSWWVCLRTEETIEIDDEEGLSLEELTASCFGGDLGIKAYLTGTNGISYNDDAEYGELKRRLSKELRRLNKKAERLKKQGVPLSSSGRYRRQLAKTVRIREKIRRKRKDFRHKLSRYLVDNYRLIALEDLDVLGMMKNRRLSWRIREQSWGDFARLLKYKAKQAGRTVVFVDRYYPSTQTCSCCGAKTGPKGLAGLAVRDWTCPECGATHDRDQNAAWNILLEGLRVLAESNDSNASQWAAIRSALVESLKNEPNGRVAPVRTDGASGIARVEVAGSASGDSGVCVDRANGEPSPLVA